MATTMTKVRKTAGRRASNLRMSDRRYYVQCSYRLAMAIISLIALIVITHGG